MTLKPVSKSEAQRTLRSVFGSLVRVEETDETVRALDDEGDLIVEVLLEGEDDPWRKLLGIACQLQRKPDEATQKRQQAERARLKNIATIGRNIRAGKPPGIQ